MFAGKTVLVLGAGSSLDFGLPLGSGLAREILKYSNIDGGGDWQISNALKRGWGDDLENFIEASRVIRLGLPQFNSIDDFLSTHDDNDWVVRLAKISIARSISNHETDSEISKLWSEDTFEDGVAWANGTWAQVIATTAFTKVKRIDVGGCFSDLTLINFNYDRCFESMLYHLIRPAFNVTEEVAADAMKSLKVIRPYGGLGPLPYAGETGNPFGGNDPDILKMSQDIKVYTEDLGERPDLVELPGILEAAENIIFLGFGFHPQNMDLLRISNKNPNQTVFATATKESAYVHEAFQGQIFSALKQNSAKIGLPNDDCKDFVTIFRRYFSG